MLEDEIKKKKKRYLSRFGLTYQTCNSSQSKKITKLNFKPVSMLKNDFIEEIIN
jgi:ribosomal protein S18